MASIMTAIEIADRVSAPMMRILNAVNQTVYAFESVQRVTAQPMDLSWIEGIRAEINEATADVALLQEEIAETANQRIAPVSMSPIQWDTGSNMQVFTNTGVERFQQEIQATTASLQVMEMVQNNAVAAAQRMSMPAAMQNDLIGMHSRIQAIQSAIQQLEASPMELGANAVNNQLEQLRSQLSQATNTQQELTAAMGRMDISAANAAYNRLDTIVGQTERSIRDNIGAQEGFNQRIRDGTEAGNGLLHKIMSMAAAYATINGAKQVIGLSDNLTQVTARLNMVVDDGGSVAELEQKIYASANRARVPYLQTADVVSKLSLRAGSIFGSNDETILFAENLNKQFAIAGASQAEIASASLQLTQALGSGVLRGEELNAVFEAAPNVIQTIADYMNVPIGKVRELAADGEVSASIVKNALIAATADINSQFDTMPKTWGQAMALIGNRAMMAFQPVLQRINDIVNSEGFEQFVNKAAVAFEFLANVVLNLFDLIGTVGSFIADNWGIIAPIVMGAAGALLFYSAAMGISAIATGIANLAAEGFFKTLFKNPIFWVALAVGFLVGKFFELVQSVGSLKIAWLIAMDKIATAWDDLSNWLTSGVYWVMDKFDEFKLGIYEASIGIQNILGDLKVGALNILQDMINGAIGLINDFTSLVNSVIGTSIQPVTEVTFGTTAALQNEIDKAQRNAALTDYQYVINHNVEARSNKLQQMEANARAAHLDRLNEIEELKQEAAAKAAAQDDPGNNYQEMLNKTQGIQDNTGSMKDSMDITQEDLKYLRDIADRDNVNRFTTAPLSINLGSITQNVNNNQDLDGIINYIADGLSEQMAITAEKYSFG